MISSHVRCITRGVQLRTVANANVARAYRGHKVLSLFMLAADRRSQSPMSRGRRLIDRDSPDRSIPRLSLHPPREDMPRRPTNNNVGYFANKVSSWPDTDDTRDRIFTSFHSLLCERGIGCTYMAPQFPCFRARDIQDTSPDL